MTERRSEKPRLSIPSSCPLEGILLAEDQFYLQNPQIFPQIYGKGSLTCEQPLSISQVNFPTARELFTDQRPLCVEFCSGNGTWIAKKALEISTHNWLAVERRLDRACKTWRRKKRLSLANLAIACAEAKLFTQSCLDRGEVSVAHVNFPDPWPKLRHAKHRLLSGDFLQEIGRILRPGGEFVLTSDDSDLVKACAFQLRANRHFTEPEIAHLQVSQTSEHHFSYFETLWRSKGREIYQLNCNSLEHHGKLQKRSRPSSGISDGAHSLFTAQSAENYS